MKQFIVSFEDGNEKSYVVMVDAENAEDAEGKVRQYQADRDGIYHMADPLDFSEIEPNEDGIRFLHWPR